MKLKSNGEIDIIKVGDINPASISRRATGTEIRPNNKVKSGIFGQTVKFGQRHCLFHISNIGIKTN